MSRALLALFMSLAVGYQAVAQSVDPVLWNATTNAGGDDTPGLSFGFTASSALPGDTVEDAFGNNDGSIEPSTFIFADAPTPDNGDGLFGTGGETTDSITWSTTSPVIVYGYRPFFQGDDPTSNRDTRLARLVVEGEVDDLFDNNGFNGSTDRLFSIPQVGNSFEFGLTHASTPAARLLEVDAIVHSTSGAVVDPDIWNATTNSGADQPAGLAYDFVASSVLGSDNVEDAFGNLGAIETGSFLFGDIGTADNGDNLFGTGGESIDFIEWKTLNEVQFEGYQVSLAGDGFAEGATRSTELMRLFVDGALVNSSQVDLNGHSGDFLILFTDGAVSGDEFRIEFTRTSGSLGAGPRILEIDAVNAVVVPEPGSAFLAAGAALAAVGAYARNHRQRRFR